MKKIIKVLFYNISEPPSNKISSHIIHQAQQLISQGLNGSIKRNEALRIINQYLWISGYQDNNNDYRRNYLRNWIETKHNNCSHNWTTDPNAVYRDIDVMVRWRKGQTPKKKSMKGSWGINNHQKAVEKCKGLIQGLLDEGVKPEQITGTKLRKKGMSFAFVGGKADFIKELVDQVVRKL